MNFDVQELYGLYVKNPKGFVQVLRNLYAYECRNLMDFCLKIIDNVGSFGSSMDRSKYIIDDLEEFDDLLMGPVIFISFFRKVDMGGHLNADDFITELENIRVCTRMARENFRINVKKIKEDNTSSNDMKKSLYDAEIKELLVQLNEVFLKLKEIDEKI